MAGLAATPCPRVSGTARIVDLGRDCLLPESLAGFRLVMAEDRIACPAGTVIPGAGTWNWPEPGPVLLECASGLVEPRPRPGVAAYIPYVDFVWPVRAKIREFFPRVCKVRYGDQVIATHAGVPVALRRGRRILLGSPIGPSLAAGDPDARRWLAAVLRWMQSA